MSRDGKTFASGGGESDQNIKVWNLSTGANLLTLKDRRGVWSLVYSPDSSKLISGGQDGTIKIWDVKSGKLLRETSIEKPSLIVK